VHNADYLGPLPENLQSSQQILLGEHPGLNENVGALAVRGSLDVAGAGGEGGDVVLGGGRLEVTVHTGALDNLGSHLIEEASQSGVTEVWAQINTAGATQEEVLEVLLGEDGIRHAYTELDGLYVRIFGPQGESWWSGVFYIKG